MKKNFISILVAISLCATSSLAETRIVTSSNDSGVNTLRQAIEDADAGDSIVISVTSPVVLESEIAFTKALKINGQGATIKVTQPGVSNYRLFNLGTAPVRNVLLENLNLEGGDVTNETLNSGGVIYIGNNLNFVMKNCTVI
jgi:hypothetical protein